MVKFCAAIAVAALVLSCDSPKVPASFDGFCIVQISDLHNQTFGPGQSCLLKRVLGVRLDLAITGDLTYHGSWSRRSVADLARSLGDIAPVYFATGNHDILADDLPVILRLLEDYSAGVLRGESVPVTKAGESIVVPGSMIRIFRRLARVESPGQ